MDGRAPLVAKQLAKKYSLVVKVTMSRQFRVQTTPDPSPTDEMRWSCDGQDCVQNVLYDQFNPNAWLTAPTTQAQCYAQAGEDKNNACSRMVCNPNVPYGCVQYDSELYDDYPNPDAFYMDSSQCQGSCDGNATPTYYCDPTGTCVTNSSGSTASYETFKECKDGCRLYGPQMNRYDEPVCAQNANYLSPGTTLEQCNTQLDQTRWQCSDDNTCVQTAMYGTVAWEDAYPDYDTCAAQSGCASTQKYFCDTKTNTCRADVSGQYLTMSSCYEDTSNPCKQLWTCNGTSAGCTKTPVIVAGQSVYNTQTECEAMTQCTQQFSCNDTTGYCMLGGNGTYGYNNCLSGCTKATNYVCDPMSATCYASYAPLAQNAKATSLSSCTTSCVPPYYNAMNLNTSKATCAYTFNPTNTSLLAKDCLTKIKYLTEDIDVTVVPSTTLFCVREQCDTKGQQIDDAYWSSFLGHGFDVATGSIPLNALANPGTFTVDKNSVLVNKVLWYSMYAPAEAGINAYRLFETTTNNDTHTSYNDYASYISSQTQASMGASLGLFNMSAQINIETNQTTHKSTSFYCNAISLTCMNAVFDLNMDVCEDWNALTPSVQAYVTELATGTLTEAEFNMNLGSHIVIRVWSGRKYMQNTSTLDTEYNSATDMQVQGCLSVGYGAVFGASVCNSTNMSHSSTFNSSQVVTNSWFLGNSSMFGVTDLSSLEPADVAMRFLMFQTAPISGDTGVRYEYVYVPSFLKNIARKTRDPTMHMQLAIASDKMTAFYAKGSKTIEQLWAKHADGTMLAHTHNLWPSYYTGWTFAIPQRTSHLPFRVGASSAPFRVSASSGAPFVGEIALAWDCTDGACVQVDGGRYPDQYSCLENCGTTSTTFDCSNNICIEVPSGGKYVDAAGCLEYCGGYECNPLTSLCERAAFGEYPDQDSCVFECAQNNPTMCAGDVCFGVGSLVTVAKNNLAMPSSPRRIFGVDALSKTSQTSCVHSIPSSGIPSTSSAKYNSSGAFTSALSTNTNVEASYTSGVTNVSATGSLATSRNLAMSNNVQQNQSYAYVPRTAYALNESAEDRHCLSYSALDSDFVNSLLSLPYVPIPINSSGPDIPLASIYEHFQFIEAMGSHVITQVNLGVAINSIDSTVSTNQNATDSLAASACVSANGLSWNANACTAVQQGSSTINTSLSVSNARSIYGGDPYSRAILSNPMTPLMAEYTDKLTQTSTAYAHPVQLPVISPFRYRSLWEQLLAMAASDDKPDKIHYKPIWEQLIVKAAELMVAYNSRWCIVDMAISQTEPPSTSTFTWTQVTTMGCGQPENMYKGDSSAMDSCTNPLGTLNFAHASNSCIGSSSMEAGGLPSTQNYQGYTTYVPVQEYASSIDRQLTNASATNPTICANYLWAKWQLVPFMVSTMPVITSVQFIVTPTSPGGYFSEPSFPNSPFKVLQLGVQWRADNPSDDYWYPIGNGVTYVGLYQATAFEIFATGFPYASAAALVPILNPQLAANTGWPVFPSPNDYPPNSFVTSSSPVCYASDGSVLTAITSGAVWTDLLHNDMLGVSVYFDAFSTDEAQQAYDDYNALQAYYSHTAPLYAGIYDVMPLLLSIVPNFTDLYPEILRCSLVISDFNASTNTATASLQGDMSQSLTLTYMESVVDLFSLTGIFIDAAKSHCANVGLIMASASGGGTLIASNYQQYDVATGSYPTLTAMPLNLSLPKMPAVVSTMYVYSALDSSTSVIRFGSLGPALPSPAASYSEPQAIPMYMTPYDVFTTPIYVYDFLYQADPITCYVSSTATSMAGYSLIGQFYGCESSVVSSSIDTAQVTFAYQRTYISAFYNESTPSPWVNNTWTTFSWNIPAYP